MPAERGAETCVGRLALASLEPMEKSEENFEFALAMKKEALGPYIIPRWGWDEERQRKMHAERWATGCFSSIVLDGEAIGTVSTDDMGDHLVLAEFYIRPRFHRQGIGTRILGIVLADAESHGLTTRLHCLKWNPARSLYERHGFTTIGETETHFLMERPAATRPKYSTPELIIRAAAPAEAADLSALVMRAKAHWGYSVETLDRWRAELGIFPEDIHARPMFVAAIDSSTAGFYSLRPSSTSWELDNLWVAPELMHRGIGRSLLLHAVDTARRAGATEILIDADPNAEAFYLSCGAVRRGQVAAPIPGEPGRVRPQLALSLDTTMPR